MFTTAMLPFAPYNVSALDDNYAGFNAGVNSGGGESPDYANGEQTIMAGALGSMVAGLLLSMAVAVFAKHRRAKILAKLRQKQENLRWNARSSNYGGGVMEEAGDHVTLYPNQHQLQSTSRDSGRHALSSQYLCHGLYGQTQI